MKLVPLSSLLFSSLFTLVLVPLVACSGSSSGVGSDPTGSSGSSGASGSSGRTDDNGGTGGTVGGGGTGGGTSDSEEPGTSTPASPGDLAVFTTKSTFNGNLGGLAGADAKCTTYANAAGLAGTVRAWLSTGTTDAITRVPQGGPWRLVDPQSGLAGDVVFANRQAWAGYPARAINRDEFGVAVSAYATSWTGTALGGFKLGCGCSDWMSSTTTYCSGTSNDYGGTVGDSNKGYSDEGWTNDRANASCETKYSLICYQI